MKILIMKASNQDFYKEVEFEHLEECIHYLLNCPDNPSKVVDFVVSKLMDYSFPYPAPGNKKIYNAGELDYIVEIYDDYIEAIYDNY